MNNVGARQMQMPQGDDAVGLKEKKAMPIHDWTRIDAGLFHDFHQGWTVALRNALNAGVLPPDYFALVEQRIHGPVPDVLTLELSPRVAEPSEANGGLAVAIAPPRTSLIRRTEAEVYAGKANRITVRHRHGNVVAVIEIVSPGNKGSQADFRAFIEKSADLVRQGIHWLLLDLFPPGKSATRRAFTRLSGMSFRKRICNCRPTNC
jgi:hypothetical protein